MPRVPVLNINNRVSEVGPAQPTVDPRQAGIVAGSLAQLGGQLGQIGTELYRRRQAEELRQWENQNSNALDKSLSSYYTSVQEKYIGTDHEGFTQEFEKGAAKIRDQYLKGANTDDKKQALSFSADNLLTKYAINADKHRFSQYRNFSLNKAKEVIDDIGTDGDYIAANAAIKDQEEFINTAQSFYPEEKQALLKVMQEKPTEIIRTMINNGQLGLAKSVLSGKDAKNTDALLKNMSAYDKSKLNAMIDSESEKKQAENYSGIVNDLNLMMNSIETGELKRTDALAVNTLKKADLLPANKRDPIVAKIAEISLVAELEDSLALDPKMMDSLDSKVDAMIENLNLKNPLLAKATAGNTKKFLKNHAAKLQDEFNKNPTDYIYKHDAKIREKALLALSSDPNDYGPTNYQAYRAAMDSNYDALGVKKENRKYTNPLFEKQFKAPIENIINNKPEKSGEMLFDIYSNIKSMAKEDTSKLLNDMKVNPSFAIVGDLVSSEDAKKVFANMAKPIKDKDYIKEYNIKESDFANELDELRDHPIYSTYLNTPYDEDSYSKAQSVLGAVSNEYKRLRINNDDMNKEAAKNLAWQMFDKSFDLINDSNHEIIIPKKVNYNQEGEPIRGYNPKNIGNFLQNYIDDSNDEVLKSTYKWQTSPDKKEVVLMAFDAEQKRYRPYNSNGKAVTFTFDELDAQKNVEPRSWIRKFIDSRKKAIDDYQRKRGYVPEGSSPYAGLGQRIR